MKNIRKLVGMVLILSTTILFSSCTNETKTTNTLQPFQVVCLQAGKADAFILMSKSGTVIIDTGEDNEGSEIVDFLQKKSITTVDYLIITHFDIDHVGGADKVLKKLTVKNVIQSDDPKNSDDYTEYLEMLSKKNITPTTLRENMTFQIDDETYSIDPPKKSNYTEKDSNNSSLVVSINHGQNSFLFTGDAENERLQELIDQGNLAHTFLKVPYHGNYLSKLPEFFKQINAKYAVITSSEKEPESQQTVDLLESNGTKVYLTRKGTVSVTSDGNNLNITQ